MHFLQTGCCFPLWQLFLQAAAPFLQYLHLSHLKVRKVRMTDNGYPYFYLHAKKPGTYFTEATLVTPITGPQAVLAGLGGAGT